MRNCEMAEFYGLLTRSQTAIAKGMDAIRRFDSSKYGQGVVEDAPGKLEALDEIKDRIADHSHEIGCVLDKEVAASVSPWRTGNLGQ